MILHFSVVHAHSVCETIKCLCKLKKQGSKVVSVCFCDQVYHLGIQVLDTRLSGPWAPALLLPPYPWPQLHRHLHMQATRLFPVTWCLRS